MATIKDFGVEINTNSYDEIAAYGIARIYNLIEKDIANYLRLYNLTPAKFNAMLIIKHIGLDGGISQIKIGKRLIVTASNMTRLIDNLMKEGYVERLKQKGDRRVNLIKITKKGRQTLENVWPGYRERISKLLNNIGKNEQKVLGNILLKWAKNLQK